MRWALFTLLLGLLCNPVWSVEVMADQDHRAAATVYSCYGERLVDPAKITADQIKPGLTRYEKDDAKKTALYSLNFGGVTGGVDSRGYLRVTIGEQLTDASKAGWTSLKTDPASGAEILFRKVEKSDADKFFEIGVRRKFGNVILSIAQRQPISASPDAAAKPVLQRFLMLVDFAKQTKLLGGQIKVVLASRSDQPELGDDGLPISVNDTKETELTLQISALDTDGAIRNDIKRMDIRVTGALAAHCKVRVRDRQLKGGELIRIADPDPKQEMTLILPAGNTPEVLQALYSDAAPADRDAPGGLGLQVGVQYK